MYAHAADSISFPIPATPPSSCKPRGNYFCAEIVISSDVGNQAYQEGGTAIGTAIAAATSTLLGLPGREVRAQMMVVMTDGYETGGSDPAYEADVARAAGITVYVVAVDVGGTTNPNSGCYWSNRLPSCIDLPTMELTAGDVSRLFVVDTFAGMYASCLLQLSAGQIIQPFEKSCLGHGVLVDCSCNTCIGARIIRLA